MVLIKIIAIIAFITFASRLNIHTTIGIRSRPNGWPGILPLRLHRLFHLHRLDSSSTALSIYESAARLASGIIATLRHLYASLYRRGSCAHRLVAGTTWSTTRSVVNPLINSTSPDCSWSYCRRSHADHPPPPLPCSFSRSARLRVLVRMSRDGPVPQNLQPCAHRYLTQISPLGSRIVVDFRRFARIARWATWRTSERASLTSVEAGVSFSLSRTRIAPATFRAHWRLLSSPVCHHPTCLLLMLSLPS